MKSLNHLICDSIIIIAFLRKVSIFVNLISHLLRSSFISLLKICSKCSMRNSEKKVYFRVKRTLLFEHFSQINRELQSTSDLQSIKNRQLIKTQKTQNRKVEINTCLRNQFALSSTKTIVWEIDQFII